MNHTRRTLACLAVVILALGPTSTVNEETAAQPVAAASTAGCPSGSKQLDYAVEDNLMMVLHGVRQHLSEYQLRPDPTNKNNYKDKAFSEFANAAVVLVDPGKLSEKTLIGLDGAGSSFTGPMATIQMVPTVHFENYLPKEVYQRLLKSKTFHLLAVGALSFPGKPTDPGLHSEPHALKQLANLRGLFPDEPLEELVWASERDYCRACQAVICPAAARFHALPYGLDAEQVAQKSRELKQAKSESAKKKVEKKYEEIEKTTAAVTRGELRLRMPIARNLYKRVSQREKDAQEKAAAGTMAADPPATTCPSAAPGAVNPASYTTATAARADSCSSPRPPGGLAKALANPAATPGGIDFSTLELRYLSDPGDGLRYAFHAEPGGPAAARRSATGERAVGEASDSFFVWLSLPSDTFWVNLNPNEPDRIVDADLGRTDAGRILLQADLELKRTTARLIHPDSSTGRRFWNKISGACMSFRTWIVPEPAEVFDGEDELYIVDAPLSVQMESQYVASRGGAGAGSCGKQSANVEAWNEQVFRDLILPRIEKAVNENPEYAELRRVYLSRVAAEWYRERSQDSPTTYGDLVDGGDVSGWVTETKWKPKDTFDQYVRSYREGEFNVSRQTRKGDYIETRTYIFGGVDFGYVELQRVSWAEAFGGQWAGMPMDTEMATETVVKGDRGSHVWMGGDNTPYVVEPYSPPPTGQPGGKEDKDGKSGEAAKDSDGTQGSTKASGEGVGEAHGPGLLGWLPLAALAGFCAALLLRNLAGRRGGNGSTEGSS